MNKRTTIIPALSLTIIIIIMSSLFTTNAQNQPKAWYVYKNATGANNGTSWNDAWTSLANINWNLISDGDTLYISGGVDSVIYNESLGSVGRGNITITKGKTAGHNGRVVIKAPTAGSGTAVTIYGRSNVKISKLEFWNWASNVYLNGTIDKFYLDSNKIMNSYGGFVTTGGGYDTTAPKKNIWITNNYITTSGWSTNQCEFSFYGTGGVYVIGNTIINNNNNPTPHDDFAQGDGGKNHYFINNYFQFTPNVQKLYDANGLSAISNHGGDWVSVNNIFVKSDRQVNGNINHMWKPRTQPTNYRRNWAKVLIVGNVSVMYSGRHFVVDYDSQAVIKNNILWRPGPFYSGNTGLNHFIMSDLEDGTPYHSVDDYVIKYNLIINSYPTTTMYYLQGGNVPPMDNTNIFIQDANTTPGFELYSLGNTDPQQFRITSSSLARNAGESNITFTMHPDNDPAALNYKNSGLNLIDYYLRRDFNGNLRDASWDIGAFEYVENQVTQDNDPPELLSAIIIDSVSVNLTFSEPVEQSSASNPSNYSIDNGILVNSVQLLSSSSIKLNTSVHLPGFYTVTVNSVTDTAGNVISPQHNSALYGYNPDPLPGILKFTPTRSNASSVPEPEHIPEKTFDGLGYNSGDPTSRWAASGLPQWIDYDLGDAKMLNKTRIQYYNWNQGRIYTYSIQVSTDSINWSPVKQNILSTNTEWTEEVFDPVPARYVRIIVHSNNQNNWASLWEAEFYGNLIISGNDDQSNIPTEFRLEQNYPNPFNPTTRIRFVIPKEVRILKDFSSQASRNDNTLVSLKVYDILGNEVATLVDENKAPGVYEVKFDANNLSSGVYLYRLQANDFIEVKKMILMR